MPRARKRRPSGLARAVSAGAADPDKMIEWAENLPPEFIECRDVRHKWVAFRAWPESKRVACRQLRCEVCKTQGPVQRIHRTTGYVIETIGSPKYEPGYLQPPGAGRMNDVGRGMIRLANTERMIAEQGGGE